MPVPAAFRTLKQTARNLVTDPPQGLRELPGRTVRAGVIGVGRLLLVADRVREEYKEVRREGVGSTVTRLRQEGVSAFGRTSPAEPAEAVGEAVGEASPRDEAVPTEEAVTEPAPTAERPTAADELPVPNYDELSVASLRARLRNLTIDQVEQLRDYEKAHADRASVVTMYEKRIAKLRSEPSAR